MTYPGLSLAMREDDSPGPDDALRGISVAFNGLMAGKHPALRVIFNAAKFDLVCRPGEIAWMHPELERSGQSRNNFTFSELYLYLHQDE